MSAEPIGASLESLWSVGFASAAPTNGNLKVEDGSGTTVVSLDVTAAGPGFVPFDPPLSGSPGTALILTDKVEAVLAEIDAQGGDGGRGRRP